MSDSGSKIDYSIRPAKSVERKIISKLLSCLRTPIPINKYRYIGFGSIYYSDFVLFHNELNITSMLSIEHSQNIDRYKINKPYQCIELIPGEAEAILASPTLFTKKEPDFIWLDYDYAPDIEIVSTIITLSQKINAGSVVFVSFNSSLPKIDNNSEMNADEQRKEQYREEFKEYFSADAFKNFDQESFPEIICSILNNAIKSALSKRSDDMQYSPVFFLSYRDGAPMFTLGFYFYIDNNIFDDEEVKMIPGVTNKNKPVKLDVPCFTRYEIRELNKLLPGSSSAEIQTKLPYLSVTDIEKYIKLYKYYPHFIDSPYYT